MEQAQPNQLDAAGVAIARDYRATISYDGANYVGWQIQPNGPSIQAAMERAVQGVCGQEVRVTASGRTDAGVHAYAQVISFQAESRLDADTWRRALNANLPEDIRVLDCREQPGFHAIRDAVGKRYRYVIDDGRDADLFMRRYAWRVRQPLDVDGMEQAARVLLGRHDFSSFEASGAPRADSIRTIRDLTVLRPPHQSHLIWIEVEADGFLYNMVRNIVGSLETIGSGKHDASWLEEVLARKDRSVAAATAPPQGLFLLRVDYADAADAAKADA